MSWWISEVLSTNRDMTERLCKCECDDTSVFPDAVQYKEDTTTVDYTIVRGSYLYCLSNSKTYRLNTSNQWVEQKDSTLDIDADSIIYDNTSSGMTSTTVQDAIDELHTTDETQDRALFELYGEDANQQLEINYAINTGAKNLFNINATPTQNHMTSTLTDDTLTVTSNGNWANYNVPVNLPSGNYIFTASISNFSKDSSAGATSVRIRIAENTSGGTALALETVTGNGPMTIPFTWTGGQFYVQFYPNYSATTTFVSTFTASNVMIRCAEITNSTFQPYALSNSAITPALIKQVDEGAKNLLSTRYPTYGSIATSHGRTFEILSDGGIKITGSAADNSNADFYLIGKFADTTVKFPFSNDNYVAVLKCESITASGVNLAIYDRQSGSTDHSVRAGCDSQNTGLQFSFDVTTVFITVTPSVTIPSGGIVVYPMICTASDWAVSQKYAPYAQTNPELSKSLSALNDFIFGLGTALSSGDNLNSLTYAVRAYAATGTIAAAILNTPWTLSGFTVWTIPFIVANNFIQILIPNTSGGKWYKRRYISSAWGSWIEYDGTEVTQNLQSISPSLNTLNLSNDELNLRSEELDTNFELLEGLDERDDLDDI